MVKNSLLAIIFGLFASCATKVVQTDNFSITPAEPTTFLIHPADNFASLSPANRKLDEDLQQVITDGLIKKGLIVAAEADLYVTYLVNVYSSPEVRFDNKYPYCGYNFMYPKTYSVVNNKEGVLIIDLKTSNGKLVWQGIKPFTIGSIEEVQAMLPDICRKIIRSYNYNL
ncbi:MAG: hypothetical protein DRI71_03675 [Bacteroidetes bacterium]|nr:MAG: hypothetical protein DRI71_03675 [Bacteroidota bacterium]